MVRTVDFPGRACLACRGACGNNSGRWEEGRGFGGKVGVPTPQTGISWDLRYWSLLGLCLLNWSRLTQKARGTLESEETPQVEQLSEIASCEKFPFSFC